MSAAPHMDRASSGKVVVSRLDNAQVLKGGALSRTAAMMCTNSRFQRFVVSIVGTVPAGFTARQHAADFIRRSCDITSRVMLDHDARAAYLFHEMVRKPFVQWQERHP